MVVVGEACPVEVVDRWAPGGAGAQRIRPDRDHDVRGGQCAAEGRVRVVPAIGAAGVGGGCCLCWMGGCVRCRSGWWGSCMWPVLGWRVGMWAGRG